MLAETCEIAFEYPTDRLRSSMVGERFEIHDSVQQLLGSSHLPGSPDRVPNPIRRLVYPAEGLLASFTAIR
jgi:hypothetical protein